MFPSTHNERGVRFRVRWVKAENQKKLCMKQPTQEKNPPGEKQKRKDTCPSTVKRGPTGEDNFCNSADSREKTVPQRERHKKDAKKSWRQNGNLGERAEKNSEEPEAPDWDIKGPKEIKTQYKKGKTPIRCRVDQKRRKQHQQNQKRR